MFFFHWLLHIYIYVCIYLYIYRCNYVYVTLIHIGNIDVHAPACDMSSLVKPQVQAGHAPGPGPKRLEPPVMSCLVAVPNPHLATMSFARMEVPLILHFIFGFSMK